MRSSARQLELDFYPHRAPFTLVRHADPHAPKRKKLELRRDRLMAQVTLLRSELERREEQANELARRAAARIAPVREGMQRALSASLGAFEKLLGPKSQVSKSDKRALNQAFTCISETLLQKLDALPEIEAHVDAQPAKKRRLTKKQESSLGETFKQLAVVLHPDLATDDVDRARRHALMREVTQAYAARDLARLVELQEQLRRGRTKDVEPSAKGQLGLRRLESINRALERQRRALRRKLAGVRAEPWGTLSADGEFEPNPALQRVLDESAQVTKDLAQVGRLLKRFGRGQLGLVDMLLALPESLVGTTDE